MKPFDPQGEYTPEEVKAALTGVSGTRQLSYRYERLDERNRFVEDVDYISSCTIENNALADIKRTAKMSILDTGNINYLKDRIKPYVRVAMPKDIIYREVLSSLDPAIWWTLDDSLKVRGATAAVPIADGLTYSTVTTAYDLAATSDKVVTAKIQSGSGTIRSEFWLKKKTTPSQANQFDVHLNANMTGTYTYEVYSSSTSDGSVLSLVKSGTLGSYSLGSHISNFPIEGYYFVRILATTTEVISPSITVYDNYRLEDSSGNKIYATGNSSVTAQSKVSGLVSDGGTAMYREQQSRFQWVTDGAIPDLTFGTGITGSFWLQSDQTSASGTENDAHIRYTVDGSDLQFTFLHTKGAPGSLTLTYDSMLYEYSIPETILGTTAHMYTFTYEFETGQVKFYMDGVTRGTFAPVDTTSDISTRLRSKVTEVHGWLWAGTGSMIMDDVSTFPYALSTAQIRDIYTAGTSGAGAGRRGYVEWPQGVFVLSSPIRKMVDGNTVVREVEGYDQLINLKEDSFDYRYSIPAGAKYTDEVAKILNVNGSQPGSPLTDRSVWTAGPGASVLSDTSFSLTDSASTSLPQLYTEEKFTSLGGASMSAKMSISGTSAEMYFSVNLAGGVVNNLLWVFDSATNQMKVIHSQPGGGFNRTLWAATYSSSTHAYWRVRESSGVIYWETSADGINWVTRHTLVHGFGEHTPMNMIFDAGFNGSATGTVTGSDVKTLYNSTQQVDLELSSATLPTSMEWETGTSKLSIVNDLLGAINYTSATYNEDGVFVARSYISPQDRSAQFTYATDSESVIMGDVDQTMDLFGVPNKWIVTVSEPDRTPITGTYVNANPKSPTSTVSRGRTIVDFRTEQTAADQVTLDALAERLAFEASQVYEVIEFDTALMPIHQNADVYNLVIDGVAVDAKYAEHSWSMNLSNGSAMSHRVRKVVTV